MLPGPPGIEGPTKIWKDGKTAAVTIFSSDGMIRSIKSEWTPQNPDVPYDGFYKLGKDYSIPFTFFLPPRGLDKRSYEPVSGVTPPAQPAGTMGTWTDWQFMHAAGHEIGSHTYSHSDLRADKLDPSKTRSGADPVSWIFRQVFFMTAPLRDVSREPGERA